MIRLDLGGPDRLQTLTLGFGVTLTVKPISTAMILAAQQAASDALQAAAPDGGDAAELPPAAVPVDAVPLAARRTVAFRNALAALAIVRWSGVVGEDGQPLPVSRPAIDALMNLYQLSEAFSDRFFLPSLILDAEKNVSTPSPTGTSAGAPATAAAAPMLNCPAPMASPA